MGLRSDLTAFYEATAEQSPSIQRTLKGGTPDLLDGFLALHNTTKILLEMIFRLGDAIDEVREIAEA